jgi:hypothetical protein
VIVASGSTMFSSTTFPRAGQGLQRAKPSGAGERVSARPFHTRASKATYSQDSVPYGGGAPAPCCMPHGGRIMAAPSSRAERIGKRQTGTPSWLGASPAFLGEIYRKVAVRYVFMAE